MALLSALPCPSVTTSRPAPMEAGWASTRAPAAEPEVGRAASLGNDAESEFTKEQMLAGQRAFRDEVAGVVERLRGLVGEPDRSEDEAQAARAVEWIDANGLSIAAMYPTHDSAEEAPKGQIRWFDADADLSEEATYDGSSRGITFRPMQVGGEAVDGGVRLYFGIAPAKIPEVLAHEVQHLVTDGEGLVGRPDQDVAGPCADPAEDEHFAGYYGEFEAYWATGDFPAATGPGGARTIAATTPDGRRVERTVRLANARQLAIFVHLCGGDTGRTFTRDAPLPYAYVPYHVACDPTFAGFVESLETFGGTNALDSVRVTRLLDRIESGEDWRPSADALTPDEAAWLLDESASAGFWARVDATPDGERLHDALRDALARCRSEDAA